MLSIEPASDGRTLIVEGEVDLATAERLLQAAIERIDEGPARLDMRGVTFLDSTGIRALIGIAERFGAIELVSPTRAVRRVLDLVSLDRQIDLRIVDEPPVDPDR
jgi:anti-anti-sigma factor